MAGGGGDGSSGSPWTLAEAATNAVGDDRVNIKGDGTYNLSTDLSPVNAGSDTALVLWRAYTTSIGDGGRATIAGGASYAVTQTQAFHKWEGLDFTSSKSANVFTNTGGTQLFDRCSFVNEGTGGAAVSSISAGSLLMSRCYLEAGSNRQVLYSEDSIFVYGCRLRRRAEGSIRAVIDCNDSGAQVCVLHSILDGGGASEDGILARQHVTVTDTVIYNVGRHGIHAGFLDTVRVANCIIYGAGGYGIEVTTSSDYPARVLVVNTAMGSVTSGRTNGLADNPEIDSVSLTGDPFTDAANDDFSLNDTSGAGALCRDAGVVVAATV